MSDSPEPAKPPKRYFRRGKIEAYRDQFMLADGQVLEGERFSEIKPVVDYIPARWYDADTGEELRDYALIHALECLYRESLKKR